MTMTIEQRIALAERHDALFRTTSTAIGAYTTVDLFINLGQSNMAASVDNPDHVVITSPSGIAFVITREQHPHYGWVTPLRNGVDNTLFFGKSSSAPPFAQRWYDLTGRKSAWCAIPVSGTPLVGGVGIDAQWDPEPYASSLVGGFEVAAGYPRHGVITQAVDSFKIRPKMQRGLRIARWCGSEADAAAGVTKAVWKAAFNRLIDYMKAEWDLDYMLVDGVGRLGIDAAEVATNAASRAEIRLAQIEVCNERADTFLVTNFAKEEGSPFNTLTVDGNGDWASGFSYYDGQHYVPEAAKVMGHTGARNAAILLGFTSGSLIGVDP